MFKKLFLIILLLITCACSNKLSQSDDKERFSLDKIYYNKSEFTKVDNLDNLSNQSYLLYTYNNFCILPVPCEDVFKEFMEKYNISIVSLPFGNFKNTVFYEKVRYAPSLIIIKNGEIISYLDANSNDDLPKYQDVHELELWLDNYINFSYK